MREIGCGSLEETAIPAFFNYLRADVLSVAVVFSEAIGFELEAVFDHAEAFGEVVDWSGHYKGGPGETLVFISNSRPSA